MDQDANRTPNPPSRAAAGSVSPFTDDVWDAYNRQACGLHYIAHKMRNMEAALRRVLEWCEQDSTNFEIDADSIRAVITPPNKR